MISGDRIRKSLVVNYNPIDYWLRSDKKELEYIVKQIVISAIASCRFMERPFVLDNTNCIIEDLIENTYLMENVDYGFKLFDVPYDVLKERVKLRDNRTEEELAYIKRYYNGFLDVKQYIFDNMPEKLI